MANKIKLEKDIYVRDKYGVRRHAFIAGTEVDEYFFKSVVTNETVVNPEDLPKMDADGNYKRSIHSKSLETKVLAEEPKQVEVSVSEDGGPVKRDRVDEAEGAELAVEATAKVAEGEPTRADGPVDKVADEVAEKSDAKEAEAQEVEAEPKPKVQKSKKGNK